MSAASTPRGLDNYDQLVDALMAAGIEPFLTLFHWDHPQELHYRGGWLNGDSPAWYSRLIRGNGESLHSEGLGECRTE